MKNHKHKFTIQLTQYEFPMGISGTSAPIEYAYLLCNDCETVKKVEVTKLQTTYDKKD